MEDVIDQAVAAIVEQDWERLRPLLHPYLHWSDDGPGAAVVRGRTRVLAMLASRAGTGSAPPTHYELRDGQIYRWTSGTPERVRTRR